MNPDFRDILSEFIAAEVDFMVVGAYALAAHGIPRATGGIDLWVRSSPGNAARVVRALAQFGAPLEAINEEDFIQPGMVVQIGVTPCRIDVLTDIDGVQFEAASQNRKLVELDGLIIPVIGRDDLIVNKRATGRHKDQVDAEQLARLPERPR